MNKTPSLRVDSFLSAPPPLSEDRGLDEAMLRAYSIERAVDYGCALEDVLKLRRRVEAGHGWADIALQLAQDNEERAATAQVCASTAARFRLSAAACCRLAQAGLEHDEARRVDAYRRQATSFEAGMQPGVAAGQAHRLSVEHLGVDHSAWFFPAGAGAASGATVVVWGGADGWCEAFHPSVPQYLERGLSVCLLELPGQGLARLRGGSRLTTSFTDAVSATVDALLARAGRAQRFGAIGHSAGGALAVAAAAADNRIEACCSNGGSVQLSKGLQKFPRVLRRFGRMLGPGTSDAAVLAFADALDLECCARTMTAPLLCLHGGQDAIVADEEAQRLVELRGASAQLERWPEGVHCLYNHAAERNAVVANWFAAQLG